MRRAGPVPRSDRKVPHPAGDRDLQVAAYLIGQCPVIGPIAEADLDALMTVDYRQFQAQVVGLLPTVTGQKFDALISDGRGLPQQVGHLLRRLRERPPGETLLDAHDAPLHSLCAVRRWLGQRSGGVNTTPWPIKYAPRIRSEAGCPKSARNTCGQSACAPPRERGDQAGQQGAAQRYVGCHRHDGRVDRAVSEEGGSPAAAPATAVAESARPAGRAGSRPGPRSGPAAAVRRGRRCSRSRPPR